MSDHQQTIIFLVRHGVTDKLYSGSDPSVDAERQLTDQGQRQAAAAGAYLASFQPVAIYSSPLDRCRETAEIIRQKVHLKDEIITDRRLLEVYETDTPEQIGERGNELLQELIGKYGGEQVVAVTHQFVIGTIVGEFLGQVYHQVPCNCADIYRLVFADKKLVEATHLTPAKDI